MPSLRCDGRRAQAGPGDCCRARASTGAGVEAGTPEDALQPGCTAWLSEATARPFAISGSSTLVSMYGALRSSNCAAAATTQRQAFSSLEALHSCRAARPSTHCRSSQSCGPPQHCTLLCYIAHELQETMSALAQQPPPVDAAEIFNNAVRAIFSRWTLLRLAVDQGGRRDGAESGRAGHTHPGDGGSPVRRVPDESEIASYTMLEGTFSRQSRTEGREIVLY